MNVDDKLYYVNLFLKPNWNAQALFPRWGPQLYSTKYKGTNNGRVGAKLSNL